MQHSELIFTLTGALVAAVVFGLLTQRMRLSPIVGYLIAGIAVGPFTPGFVAHAEIAEQLDSSLLAIVCDERKSQRAGEHDA